MSDQEAKSNTAAAEGIVNIVSGAVMDPVTSEENPIGSVASEAANSNPPATPAPHSSLGESSIAEESERQAAFPHIFSQRVEKVRLKIKTELNNAGKAMAYLNLLEQAQNLVSQGSSYYEEAERLLSEVEYHLAFRERMARASRRVGIPLFFYEVIWFIILIWILIQINTVPTYEIIRNSSPITEVNLVHLLSSLIWGGLGGVVGALYALWKHIAKEQDFDPQYALWYLTNPVLGVMLGGFIFLVIQAGFFSLTAGVEPGLNIRSAFVIYVLAWISGFKQNVVYEIVRRILDVFRVETSPTSSGASAETGTER
ncbi:MAG: hypothetical protein ACPLUL_00305 [Thermanaerothrix sp.]|uniref:hypothetical protein n=1 Tax=Thermanaerothrix sp. TaxID=2972675 RepID=UPI003C7B325E